MMFRHQGNQSVSLMSQPHQGLYPDFLGEAAMSYGAVASDPNAHIVIQLQQESQQLQA